MYNQQVVGLRLTVTLILSRINCHSVFLWWRQILKEVLMLFWDNTRLAQCQQIVLLCQFYWRSWSVALSQLWKIVNFFCGHSVSLVLSVVLWTLLHLTWSGSGSGLVLVLATVCATCSGVTCFWCMLRRSTLPNDTTAWVTPSAWSCWKFVWPKKFSDDLPRCSLMCCSMSCITRYACNLCLL